MGAVAATALRQVDQRLMQRRPVLLITLAHSAALLALHRILTKRTASHHGAGAWPTLILYYRAYWPGTLSSTSGMAAAGNAQRD
ncbi:hypothetical protein NC315_34415 [Streptomyces sp. G2]|uniref:hypothetical protein n=1 Tax=Streptomyces sp. G2 TaxID=1684471 RepID=UPI00202F5CAB|nr:hypothetical protein [Streptomyces sp. G2]MCM1950424.1 hypothetical protein [Streptomyces sp. G2]